MTIIERLEYETYETREHIRILMIVIRQLEDKLEKLESDLEGF